MTAAVTPGRWVTAGRAGVHGTFYVRSVRTEQVGEVVDCWGGTAHRRQSRTFRASMVRPAPRPPWARDLPLTQLTKLLDAP